MSTFSGEVDFQRSAGIWHQVLLFAVIFFLILALHYIDQFLLTEEGSMRLVHIVQEKE